MAWPTTSRQSRGYGAEHDKMRAHLMATVILCEECTRNGRVTPGSIADHKIPKSKGGTDARENYQLLCPPCSDAKTIADKATTGKPRRVTGDDGLPLDPSDPWRIASTRT